MCSGSESKYQDASSRGAEAGDWSSPVDLVAVGAAAGFADSSAVIAEARAKLARSDGLTNLVEDRKRN
jgi:hypothetical protein